MNVTLVGFTKKGVRKDISVPAPNAVIGRTTEADIQIPVSDVSRRHCQIAVNKNMVTIKDLGSSNGTFVNDKKVSEVVLKAGDRLKVGPFTFVVQIDGQPKIIKPLPTAGAAGKPASSETRTKAPTAPTAKPAKSDDDFDLDDLDVANLEDVDVDELSPLDEAELEEISPDELEEIDSDELHDEEHRTPKGK
jgi:predicted component of type VI protein secretion system